MEPILWMLAGAAFGFALGWGVFASKNAAAKAHMEMLKERLAEQQELMRQEFRNTAHTMFEDFSQKFSSHSQKQIGDILHPLRERITEFQKLVGDSFTAHGKEQYTLKAEIEKISKMNDSLTRALRGDVKAQGNWGEVILERVLEESGLRKGIDYVAQGSNMGLMGAEGNRLRPDVIVHLPDNKHIIIDSKVSLVAYERYSAAQDEASRATHLKDFVKSVRAHLSNLEQKRYQDIDKLGTPDFVFMFMPIEGAYSLAMQNDSELQFDAWKKDIVITTPGNLFSYLNIVAAFWRIDSQNKHAQEIARQGGRLYDKFVAFIADMNRIGERLTGAQKVYGEAMNKLVDGKDNLVRQTEKLKTLGANTTKSIPAELMDDTEESEEEKSRRIA